MIGAQRDVARQGDLCRVAADVLAVCEQNVSLSRELLHGAGNEVPVLGVPGGGAQGTALAAAADADRRGGAPPAPLLPTSGGPAGIIRPPAPPLLGGDGPRNHARRLA